MTRRGATRRGVTRRMTARGCYEVHEILKSPIVKLSNCHIAKSSNPQIPNFFLRNAVEIVNNKNSPAISKEIRPI